MSDPPSTQRVRGRVVATAGGLGVLCLAVGALARGWEPPAVEDLLVYRHAAARVLDAAALYPPGSRYAAGLPLPFTYPPSAALFAVPLALVPIGSAVAAWWLLSLLALAWLVARGFEPLTARLAPIGRAASVLLLTCAAVLGLSPVWRTLGFGQVGLLLAAACLLDLDLALRRSRAAGVLVGIATSVKLVPGAFLLTLAGAGRRRATAVALATVAAMWLLAALLLPDDTRDWLGLAGDVERIGPIAGAVNTTWHGLWLRLLGDSALSTALWTACSLATLGIATVRSGRMLRRGEPVAAATVMGLASVVSSPVAWLHHAVWVVPLIGIVVHDGRSWRRWMLALGIAAVFSVPATAWQDLEPGSPELAGVLDWWWVNAAVLVMAAAVALLRPARGRSTSGPRTGPRDVPASKDDVC